MEGVITWDTTKEDEFFKKQQAILNKKICRCGKEMVLTCRKETPLYYIMGHIHREIELKIYKCPGCGMARVEVPETVWEIEDKP